MVLIIIVIITMIITVDLYHSFFLSDDNLAAVTSGWISDPATGIITPKKTGRDTNSDLNIFVNFIIPLPFFCYSLHSYDRAMFNSVVK